MFENKKNVIIFREVILKGLTVAFIKLKIGNFYFESLTVIQEVTVECDKPLLWTMDVLKSS